VEHDLRRKPVSTFRDHALGFFRAAAKSAFARVCHGGGPDKFLVSVMLFQRRDAATLDAISA